MGLPKTKPLLHSKQNNQQNQKSTEWEDICKSYLPRGYYPNIKGNHNGKKAKQSNLKKYTKDLNDISPKKISK